MSGSLLELGPRCSTNPPINGSVTGGAAEKPLVLVFQNFFEAISNPLTDLYVARAATNRTPMLQGGSGYAPMLGKLIHRPQVFTHADLHTNLQKLRGGQSALSGRCGPAGSCGRDLITQIGQADWCQKTFRCCFVKRPKTGSKRCILEVHIKVSRGRENRVFNYYFYHGWLATFVERWATV